MFHPKNLTRRYAHKSVRLSDLSDTMDKGCSDPEIKIDSPSLSLNRFAPSRLTQAAFLPSITFSMRISALACKIIGRKLSECGANGVKQMQWVLASRMEPPAAKL